MQFIKKIKDKIGFGLFTLFSQFLFLSEAHAQLATPSASDMSRQFINQIFGSLLDGGQDAFGGSIAAFNGGILTVGGILVAYTILAGTLGTAHDGEMLGKKFSSVWVPIRTALGTALVLPVMSGGYCVMQAIVMWLIMQGVSLGNSIWVTYAGCAPGLTPKFSTLGKDQVRKFVEDVYLAQVCLQSKKKAYDETSALLKVPGRDYKVDRDTDGIWYFGNWGTRVFGGKSVCGTVTPPPEPKVVVTSAPTSTTISSINSLGAIFKSPDLKPFYNIHMQEIQKVIDQTGTIALSAMTPGSGASYSQIQSIIDGYVSAVNGAVSSYSSAGSSSLASMASQQGWFMAGAWATQIITLQNKISSAVNSSGSAEANVASINDSSRDEATRFGSLAYEILSQNATANNLAAQSGEKDESNSQKIDGGGTISQFMAKLVTGIDLEKVKTDTRHPLVLMSQIGDSILSSILTAVTILGSVAAGSAVIGMILPKAPDLSPLFIAIFGTLGFPLMGFMGVAGMLSYILPNTPFLIWLGIIIGWTIMVVEAILAAPLWAVMHLHPNGDDMTGRGGNGYMLVLGLLLRPALIIFGLIAAITLSDLFGKLLNAIFFDVFSANNMAGSLGFFAMLFGTSLYATAMFMIIKNTFNLMHIVPDQLMRWIGGGGEQLGQYANQISEGAVQKGHAVAGAAVGLAMKDSAQGTIQGVQNLKQLNEARNNKNAQREGNFIAQETGYQAKDASGGIGAGDIDRGIDQEFAGNSLAAAESKNIANNASMSLGGKDSVMASDYRQSLLQNMSEGVGFKQAHANALNNTIGQHFGGAASSVLSAAAIQQSGNPDTSSKQYQQSFAALTQSVSNKMDKLESNGMSTEQAQQTMSQMFSNVQSKMSEGSNVTAMLKAESASLNVPAPVAAGIGEKSDTQ